LTGAAPSPHVFRRRKRGLVGAVVVRARVSVPRSARQLLATPHRSCRPVGPAGSSAPPCASIESAKYRRYRRDAGGGLRRDRLRAPRRRQSEERRGSGVDPAWGWGSPRVRPRGRVRCSVVLPAVSSRRTRRSHRPAARPPPDRPGPIGSAEPVGGAIASGPLESGARKRRSHPRRRGRLPPLPYCKIPTATPISACATLTIAFVTDTAC
jgi:hypothetical protein